MYNSLYTIDESHDSDEIPNKTTVLITIPTTNIHRNVRLIEDIYSYIHSNKGFKGKDMCFKHNLVVIVYNIIDFSYLHYTSSQN